VGKVKPQLVRCQLVLDAKGKQLIRSKNTAKHRLPDGTPLCTVHWRMSGEGKRKSGMQARLQRWWTFSIGENMQINDNGGKKIGRIDTSVSRDRVVTVHETRNVTIITTRDRNTGKVKSDTLIGESPFGR